MATFFGRLRPVAFVAGLLVAFTASALDYNKGPTAIGYHVDMARTGVDNGVMTQATFEAYNSAISGGQSRGAFYAARTFKTGSGTIGNLAKSALKGLHPSSIARGVIANVIANVIIDGAGMFIDEINHEVLDGPPASSSAPQGTTVYTFRPFPDEYYSTVNVACYRGAMKLVQTAFGAVLIGASYQPGIGCTYQMKLSDGRTLDGVDYVYPYVVPEGGARLSDPEPNPVSDDALGQKLIDGTVYGPNHDPTAINDLLVDGQGNPIRTPELVQALNDLQHAVEDQNQQPRSPDQVPDPNYNTQPAPDDKNDTQIPKFCTWASYVCDWIDWTKQEPDTETPPTIDKQDVAVQKQWNGLSDGGTCPSAPSTTITFAGQAATMMFGYDSICSFALKVRPMVMAVGAVVAAFIVYRGRNA